MRKDLFVVEFLDLDFEIDSENVISISSLVYKSLIDSWKILTLTLKNKTELNKKLFNFGKQKFKLIFKKFSESGDILERFDILCSIHEIDFGTHSYSHKDLMGLEYKYEDNIDLSLYIYSVEIK